MDTSDDSPVGESGSTASTSQRPVGKRAEKDGKASVSNGQVEETKRLLSSGKTWLEITITKPGVQTVTVEGNRLNQATSPQAGQPVGQGSSSDDQSEMIPPVQEMSLSGDRDSPQQAPAPTTMMMRGTEESSERSLEVQPNQQARDQDFSEVQSVVQAVRALVMALERIRDGPNGTRRWELMTQQLDELFKSWENAEPED